MRILPWYLLTCVCLKLMNHALCFILSRLLELQKDDLMKLVTFKLRGVAGNDCAMMGHGVDQLDMYLFAYELCATLTSLSYSVIVLNYVWLLVM